MAGDAGTGGSVRGENGFALKAGLRQVERRGVRYLLDAEGKPLNCKPWVVDLMPFIYDKAMEASVFPRKFGADLERHFGILRVMTQGLVTARVIDVAAGSGSAVRYLPATCRYAGVDVSPGLLRLAVGKLGRAGFRHASLHAASAQDLPFSDTTFDVCLCVLALNFFDDAMAALREIRRVLVEDGCVIGCVPVPERNRLGKRIKGTLYGERQLSDMALSQGLRFEPWPADNGILLYFRACCEKPPSPVPPVGKDFDEMRQQ